MRKYYCSDCGIELDEGEGSVFTCCEPCWNKHYKKTDEQSEVSVEAKVSVPKPNPQVFTINEVEAFLQEQKAICANTFWDKMKDAKIMGDYYKSIIDAPPPQEFVNKIIVKTK